mmetsp:Transcript_16887/g.26167  ORF Transcript_16887/g.26167 Transcript_16887/m.26167 type:complete len:304 (+) Transcript_16887:145-1056(+)
MAWKDIYRYVATTPWGLAAGLSSSGLGQKFPIYKQASHALKAPEMTSSGTPGNRRSSMNPEVLRRKSSTFTGSGKGGVNRRSTMSEQELSLASTRPQSSFIHSTPNSGKKARFLGDHRLSSSPDGIEKMRDESEDPDTPHPMTYNVVDGLLRKLKAKWQTVHSVFSKFAGRPNEYGGFDWAFDKEQWSNSLRILNLGVSESEIEASFDIIDADASGLITFDELQEAMRAVGHQISLSPEKTPNYSASITPQTPNTFSRSPSLYSVGSVKRDPTPHFLQRGQTPSLPGSISRRLSAASQSLSLD